MKYLSVKSLLQRRYLLAIFAGLLLAASFPKIGIAGLAWVAPALILAAAFGKRGGEAFRLGYVAGLAHYLASLYWLLLIPYRWHGIPLAPATGWLALSAYLALYPAIWVWLLSSSMVFVFPRWGEPSREQFGRENRLARSTPSEVSPRQLARQANIDSGGWARRMMWGLAGAATWVALEMVQARLLTGFPWNLLGVSQYQLLPLLQIASMTGVYGVSFLVVWTSLCLFSAALAIVGRPALRSAWIGEIILPLAALVAVFGFGFRQLAQQPVTDRELNIALVQPNIPQTVIWDSRENTNRFRQLIELSERALALHPDLLIWPEAAVPDLLRYDEATFQAVTGLARSNRVWMIVGTDDAEPRLDSPEQNAADYFNSSFLISREGELLAAYRKRRLVIFGEYVPLQRWLPFLKYFTPVAGGFTPGDRPVPFNLDRLGVKTSVLICFEDIFPHLARGHVEADTDFLVNLTNNGWFGESAAQWQHAANAVFRAIENGLPLVRCANNGLTCWVDAHGRLRQILSGQQGTVYGAGVMSARIPLPAPGERSVRTFYNGHGDWFAWACVAVAAPLFLATVVNALRRRGSDAPPNPIGR